MANNAKASAAKYRRNPKASAAEYRRKKQAILNELAQGWSIQRGCAAAGIDRTTYYDWRRKDPEFAQAADAAIEAGTDLIEDEITRRAVQGTLKPVFYQGEVCGEVREYSDTLAVLIAKGRRPHKFRENVTLTGGDGGPVQVEQIKRVIVDPKDGS